MSLDRPPNKRLSGLRAKLGPPGGTALVRADQINVCWTNPIPARRGRPRRGSLERGDCIPGACPGGNRTCSNVDAQVGQTEA